MSPRLGAYTLRRSLGSGGLGEVFEAQDALGRRVALKTMSLQQEDADAVRAAFEREATLGRRLEHPGIVRLLDSGVADGVAYLAFELVEGHDLSRHTRGAARLPLAPALELLACVAEALAAAHAQGVIHRDVKPENVLIDARDGAVKLTDFGVARLGEAFRSRTGVLVGTPGYMAPEQLAEGALDARCDLYALGVIAFELLAGRRPHDALTLGALLLQVTRSPAPSLLQWRPDLPAGVADLVAGLLERDPARRPASAAAVAERLRALSGAGSGAHTHAAAAREASRR